MRFTGQSAIVTGSARGIGEAIARRIAAEGGSVMIADIDVERGSAIATDIGGGALGQVLDVTSEESWATAVERAVASWGKVDILVNNAGVAGRAAPSWELSLAEWKVVIDIDLTGVFLGCRSVLPGMIDKGYGRIVNIASIAGKDGNPNMAHYSAAKAAVIGLTKSIGKEVAQKGVLVNAVAPAVVETDILLQLTPAQVDYMISKIPMGRVGKTEEVATLVAFLSSSEVTFSTGAVFDLSGGRATY